MADKIATRAAYGETLVEVGAENPNLVVMDADLSGSTMTKKFGEAYPDRFFNMGIAEQNLYAAAAGIALSGKTVCASTFAMFAATPLDIHMQTLKSAQLTQVSLSARTAQAIRPSRIWHL